MACKYLLIDIDKKRLLKPVVRPEPGLVTKGRILELAYPNEKTKGVFYQYTIGESRFPTFFSGERYNNNNKIQINDNMTIRVCACKEGFLDSPVLQLNYTVTDQVLSENKIQFVKNHEGIINEQMRRDEVNWEMEYRPLSITELNDESSSIISSSNPGSSYMQSFHKR